jgi:hypothetical protein
MCINKGTLTRKAFPSMPTFSFGFNCNDSNSYKTKYLFDKSHAVWFYMSGRCKKWNACASWKCLRNLSKSSMLWQGCTNPRCQFAQAAKFCVLALNTYGSWVCNSLCVTCLAPRNLMLLTDFGKFVDLCVTISLLVTIVQYSCLYIHHEFHTIM